MLFRKLHDKVKHDYEHDLYTSEVEQNNYFLKDKATEIKESISSLGLVLLILICSVNGDHGQAVQIFLYVLLIINSLGLLWLSIKLWCVINGKKWR
ncbi:hypothetical protein H5S09_07505 [Limosilactobacillus sp. STM2_1]|uniref:Uncharacterized protein n=1 Tax=Limosilactobacillus rudii TaxID=2759755 RepID=A0A7W3YNK9_9LACO|nr:hypothetical protein [Limosilactobacillus rudii]MBB1079755.1 hypothetical protein [Limosilactobacillus rudii]MBB1097785.1 hypothetical protein [Limosilactobacillus rudii]MCD7134866.1 hypothetical protein [Limosilactobacillus rudii]